MSDLFGDHIVGFPTRRLKYQKNEYIFTSVVLSFKLYLFTILPFGLLFTFQMMLSMQTILQIQFI